MITKILFFLALLILSCCSFIQDKSAETEDSVLKRSIIDNKASTITIENRHKNDDQITQSETEYGLEVIWDIPEENVDGYVIYSGQSPDNLDSELHIRISDLKVIDDKEYSYTISPVDPDKPIYVAIAAKTGDLISEQSPAKEYLPDAKFSQPENQ